MDSIGQLVALCEKDGFIPKYYHDKPNDKIDRTIEDMQKYTRDLVTEELGLGNLIENAVKQLQEEQKTIQSFSNASVLEEDKLFDYSIPAISDQDYIDFEDEMNDQFDEDDLDTLFDDMEKFR